MQQRRQVANSGLSRAAATSNNVLNRLQFNLSPLRRSQRGRETKTELHNRNFMQHGIKSAQQNYSIQKQKEIQCYQRRGFSGSWLMRRRRLMGDHNKRCSGGKPSGILASVGVHRQAQNRVPGAHWSRLLGVQRVQEPHSSATSSNGGTTT
jgi:hypothetical protein